MILKFDLPIKTSVGESYVHKSYHRNGNPNKSQWTVVPTIEVHLFEISYQNVRNTSPVLWSLHIENGVPVAVGISCTAKPPQRPLKIARFNHHKRPDYWSGYPADYRSRHQDRPPISVLKEWVAAGIISTADMSRVRGSKACNL